MTSNPVISTPTPAHVGQAIRLDLPQLQAAPQHAPRPRPATWHLGSRGVWKERRVKTLPA